VSIDQLVKALAIFVRAGEKRAIKVGGQKHCKSLILRAEFL
jgi:hypothetical protein